MKRIILAAIVVIYMLSACGPTKTEAPNLESARIKVAAVSHEKLNFPVYASGLVVSAQEVKLSFKTGGIIKALHAEEGTKVMQGMLLASLDLSEIDAQVKQANQMFDKAMRDYARAKSLYTDSVVTLELMQNAETALQVARANLDVATFNRDHSSILAPADGVILRKLVEPHEVIAPGYPVYLLGITGKSWKIKSGLADRNYVQITRGDSAMVTFDAYPGEQFRAIVSQVGEVSNPYTGTYEIELDLLPIEQRIASGFVANLEIYPSRTRLYYRIPVAAIVEAEGQTGYVFAITDSARARKIPVTLSGIVDTWAAVSEGLEGIREVATEGAAYLTDGDAVTVVR